MTTFDADLVHGWFGRLRDTETPVMPHWGIVPTAEESAALAAGAAMVAAALQDRSLPDAATDLTEVPARLVGRYLAALAAGIVGTRQVLVDQVVPRAGRDDGADEAVAGAGQVRDQLVTAAGTTADVGALSLVTGLNAAAAALHGEIAAPAYRSAESRHGAEPSAAESVRLAGVSAAELVVNGAGLHEIAAAAAGATMGGWKIGLPDDPAERTEYRVRGLIGMLLFALEEQTRDPAPPGEPASCGARPGENLGHPFPAEVTFTMGLALTEVRALCDDLEQLAGEVTVWPGSLWPSFHVHTDRPGEVVGQIYAYGTPFDLVISDRS